MKEIIIQENEAGKRLDRLLKQYLSEASSGFLYKMLRKKNITLNGKKADGTEKLVSGDIIRVFMADETIEKFGNRMLKAASDQNMTEEQIQPYLDAYRKLKGITVLFENHHLVFVNKPVGVLSQKAEPEDMSLNEWLIGYLLKTGKITAQSLTTYHPSICNRIDRNTSGIVVCAVTLPGAQQMARMLKERTIGKFYKAVVAGVIEEPAHIKARIIKNEKTNTVKILPWKDSAEDDAGAVQSAGDPIETAYRPVAVNRKDQLTCLEVELLTGKTHQIRAHLSSTGHPLVGDYKYGNQKLNEKFRADYGVRSQLLHSYRLEFPQMEEPFSDLSGMKIVAPVPDPMRRILTEKFHLT
ncbi:MAG: RluA family pseudouridine synthase [Butyrivibrio sp.]|jgi:23S rRNA pseudouridine955/2504/2580 synthase|nr:RluA family pseudouridine synthase [Butyrivibrio sp.]